MSEEFWFVVLNDGHPTIVGLHAIIDYLQTVGGDVKSAHDNFDDATQAWEAWKEKQIEEQRSRYVVVDYKNYLKDRSKVGELADKVYRLGGEASFVHEYGGLMHTLFKKHDKPLVEVYGSQCFILDGYEHKRVTVKELVRELLGMGE